MRDGVLLAQEDATPLMTAALYGSIKTATALVAAGADLDAVDKARVAHSSTSFVGLTL